MSCAAKKERTNANVEAIQILTSKASWNEADREKLRRYTGWGGLSIRRAAKDLPSGWIPEKKALIHEYYTPERVANAIAQTLLPYQTELAQSEGHIIALEPSAGSDASCMPLTAPCGRRSSGRRLS